MMTMLARNVQVVDTKRYSCLGVVESNVNGNDDDKETGAPIRDEATIQQQPRRRKQTIVLTDEKERLRILSQLRAMTGKEVVAQVDQEEEIDAGEVLEDSIWVGSLQATRNIASLRRLQITSILTTARGLDVVVEEGMRHRVVPLVDHPAEDLLGKLNDCFAFLNEELAANRRVLVHCASGVSRSVSVCVAYVMVEKRWNLKASLECIRRNRAFANPNVGFMIQLRQLESFNGDVALARQSYQARLKGKPITESIVQWRNKANELHHKVDDLENMIKSCTTMSDTSALEKMFALKKIGDEAATFAASCIEDNISQMVLKSVRGKSDRLQEALQRFIVLENV